MTTAEASAATDLAMTVSPLAAAAEAELEKHFGAIFVGEAWPLSKTRSMFIVSLNDSSVFSGLASKCLRDNFGPDSVPAEDEKRASSDLFNIGAAPAPTDLAEDGAVA